MRVRPAPGSLFHNFQLFLKVLYTNSRTLSIEAGDLKHEGPKEGKDEEAITALRALAEGEESSGDEPEDIPAREMLADLLLEAKHPGQALTEYEADLKFNPNRFDGLYGAATAAEMAGKTEKATNYYAQLVKNCTGGNSGRPELGKAKALMAGK